MESTSSSVANHFGQIDWFYWTSVFQNIFVGLGSIAAIIFGWIQVLPIVKAFKKENADYWMKKYPKRNFGGTFKLIESSKRKGKIYLLDLKTNTKHHIASQPTRYDINMDDLEVETIGKEDFDKIEEGERILTKGKPGD